MNPPLNIFELIESVTEDGELSQDEVITISLWLKNNPACRRRWPGSKLQEALTDVDFTKKITKQKLKQLGKLLCAIPHERAQRENATVVKETRDLVIASLASFNPTRPLLPRIAILADVASESYSGVRYTVDLSGPSCNCPDGIMRQQFPIGCLNRCCKHVIWVFLQIRPQAGWPAWMDVFLSEIIPPKPDTKWIVVNGSSPALIRITPRDWSDVYSRKRVSYARYGYNRAEKRWAYGDAPKDGDAVAAAIHKHFRKGWFF